MLACTVKAQAIAPVACQGAMVRVLARKLEGTGVVVNAVNPDVTKTTLIREAPWWLKLMFSLTGQTPEVGAKGPLTLAMDPALEKVSGKFFTKTRETPFPKAIGDDATNQKVWDESARLVGLG